MAWSIFGAAVQLCGGENESAIHWDILADMTDGGDIYADGELIIDDRK